MASCQRSSRPRRLICTVAAARWRPAGWALHGLLPMGCSSLSEKMVKQHETATSATQWLQPPGQHLMTSTLSLNFSLLFSVTCSYLHPLQLLFGSWRSSPALPSPNCDPTIAVAKLGFWCPTFLKVRWHQNKSWSSLHKAFERPPSMLRSCELTVLNPSWPLLPTHSSFRNAEAEPKHQWIAELPNSYRVKST